MKKIKSAVALILMFALVLTFAGCSKESDKFIGKWKTTIDLSQDVNDEIASEDGMEEVADLIKIEGYAFDYVWTFNEDGTYSRELTSESIESATKAFEDSMRKSYEDLFKYGIEKSLKEANISMTADEYIAQNFPGKTIDEIMKENGIDVDSIINESIDMIKMELIDQLREEGNFEVKDGKVFFSAGKDYAVDENVYDTYEFTDDGKLKLIEEVDPSDDSEELEGLFPLTFEKIS